MKPMIWVLDIEGSQFHKLNCIETLFSGNSQVRLGNLISYQVHFVGNRQENGDKLNTKAIN